MGYCAEPDEDKLAELILSVAQQIQDDYSPGATKLNKVPFLAECSHVRAQGEAIPGAAYEELPEGPTPLHLVPIRDGCAETARPRW